MNSRYYFRSELTTSVERGDVKVRFTIAFYTEGRFHATIIFRAAALNTTRHSYELKALAYLEALNEHPQGFFSAVHIPVLRERFGVDAFSLKGAD
jgi:hypothetical protein